MLNDEELSEHFAVPRRKLYSNGKLVFDYVSEELHAYSKKDGVEYELNTDVRDGKLLIEGPRLEEFYFTEPNCKGDMYVHYDFDTYNQIVGSALSTNSGRYCKPQQEALAKKEFASQLYETCENNGKFSYSDNGFVHCKEFTPAVPFPLTNIEIRWE